MFLPSHCPHRIIRMSKAEVAVLRRVVLNTGTPAPIMRVLILPRLPFPHHLLPSQVTCSHVIACRHMWRCIRMRPYQHTRTLPLHGTLLPLIPKNRTRNLRKTRLHHGQHRKNRQNPDLSCWTPGKLVVWMRMHMLLLLHQAAASAVANRWPLPTHCHTGSGGEAARIVDLEKAKAILEGHLSVPPLRHYTLLSPTLC